MNKNHIKVINNPQKILQYTTFLHRSTNEQAFDVIPNSTKTTMNKRQMLSPIVLNH